MSAPIRHTCPKIDEQIRELKSYSLAFYRCNDNSTKEHLLDVIGDIKYHIEHALFYFLEEIRNDNDSLRTWGKEMEQSYFEAQDEVNRLEKELEIYKIGESNE